MIVVQELIVGQFKAPNTKLNTVIVLLFSSLVVEWCILTSVLLLVLLLDGLELDDTNFTLIHQLKEFSKVYTGDIRRAIIDFVRVRTLIKIQTCELIHELKRKIG